MAITEYNADGTPIHSGKRAAETISAVQLFRRFPD